MFLSSLFVFFVTSQTALPPVDPSLEYRTKTTEHFYIHYDSELEQVASRLAEICEPIFSALTEQLEHRPSSRTHVVLLNNTDSANGFSTPLPYNSVYLNIASPPEGSSLDDYDDWLVTLFTHEFTHTIHIDMAYGINKIPRALLGRFWVPNAAQPQWLIEGFAMYNETIHTTGGRGRSSFIDMYLRTAALENKLLPIEAATYWYNEYPYGGAAYWYGVGFYQYLAKRFGQESLTQFAKENASWFFIGWFNLKTRNIFGTSFARLWSEWQKETTQNWSSQVKRYTPSYQTKAFPENFFAVGQASYDQDTDQLYLPLADTEKRKTFLGKLDLKTSKIEKLIPSFSSKRLSIQKPFLVYSTESEENLFNQYSGISIYNLEEKKSYSLRFKGLNRLQDPEVRGKKIYVVQNAKLSSRLLEIELPQNLDKLETKEEINAQVKELVNTNGFGSIHSPRLSPNGRFLVFSMFKDKESRDLYLYDLSTHRQTRLTQDLALDYFPSFSPDGQWVIFSSDRLLANTDTKVFNAYAIHLKDQKILQLTDSWSGVFWPASFSDKLAFGEFTSEGFKAKFGALSLTTDKLKSLTKEAVAHRKSPILEDSKSATKDSKVETTKYKMGTSLLPHYLAPISFITEDDSAVGLLTGSNDPLAFHRWSGFGAYLSSPNRGIAGLNYAYYGFAPLRIDISGSTGISDYGKIIPVIPTPGQVVYDDYYERNYYGSVGLSSPFYWDGKTSSYFARAYGFFEHREALFTLPANRATSLTGRPDVQIEPEQGNEWGVGLKLAYSKNENLSFYDFSAPQSTNIFLEAEYTPPSSFGSDFETLTTVFNASIYKEIFSRNYLATRLVVGNQWKDVLYQKSFRLGGSFGSSPFSQISRQSYALRGFESGEFRGEGIVLANLEYRFPLTRHIPGFGTAPIWFKNLNGAVFTDAGQSFQRQNEASLIYPEPQNFKLSRFNWSAGVELKSQVSLFYAPPFTYRLGYAYVLRKLSNSFRSTERSDWVLSDRIDQIYFQIGQSF